ncbi:hypothetical protein GT347_22075 [Xylophilus rhododendri]|uniref:Uncharacterized protein n=1 Tax=Xylophilus rhododendri TaxID=2697032 RepID=A0A857JCL8_9BURK|nr:hypothetical protein [Xylophilus rhododendri]QHJ00426.1 hypothetical protein GT347_22075 [Xylophilus rhododendri]
MTKSPERFDLAGGEYSPPSPFQTLDEIIAESRSRKYHRTASAVLVYLVVAGLLVFLAALLLALKMDLAHASTPVVAIAASTIVSITVLTIALAKYSFGMGDRPDDSGKKEKGEAFTAPTIEMVKVLGDVVGKAGEALKGLKP